MIGESVPLSSQYQTFPSTLKLYLWMLLALVLIASTWLLFNKPILLVFALAGIIASVVIVTPRLALLQFMFLIFLNPSTLITFNTYMIDFSAGLVIISALFDLLLHTKQQKAHLPTLSKNYLILLGAVIFTSLFSFNIIAALKPAMRLMLLFITFISLFRLIKYEKIEFILKSFLLIATMHALIVSFQFIQAGGSERAFGFSHIIFDDIAMITAPIALSYFLWSEKGKRWKYLISFIFLVIALLATQSRVSIVYGAFAIFLTIVISHRKAKSFLISSIFSNEKLSNTLRYIRSKIAYFVLGTVIIFAIMIISQSDIVIALKLRFERLITSTPGGTFATRITLWKAALRSFSDYPLVGIGPGYFKQVASVYPTFHLELLHYWVRGLSAHNLSLHYLAETGLIGAFALWALFTRQYLFARKIWKQTFDFNLVKRHLSLYIVAIILLISTFIEAGWMWGTVGYLALFFMVLINHAHNDLKLKTAAQKT